MINGAAYMVNKNDVKARVVVFGTIMFEESQKIGINYRDNLQKMVIGDQNKLQDVATPYSILTGTPFTIVMNRDGKVDEAALQIVNALGDKN